MSQSSQNNNKNTILILLDQFISYDKLPPNITEKLKGFQLLKKEGVVFENIRNCRQMCSPSRSTIFTSRINHGVQDNIDQQYQYDTVPQINNNYDNIAKSLKRNNINVCGYFGKDHFISKENYNNFNLPAININSNGTFKQYGFDENNLYGDSFYFSQKGYLADSLYFSTIVNNNIENYQFKDLNGIKSIGILPFLKSRVNDGRSFHAQFHLTNPHDSQEFWDNLSQTPKSTRLQYWAPFLQEQTTLSGIDNPYVFNQDFQNAFATDKELTTNFFEKLYDNYKNNEKSLPRLNSYLNDYVSSSKLNSIDATLVSFQELYKNTFTLADDSKDIKSWKNLINNYYGLLLMSDNYVYQIIKFLKETNLIQNTNLIVTSDHGEQLGAHGLKQKYVHFEESQRTDVYILSNLIDNNCIGKSYNVLGSSLDINPTLETLANIKNPSNEFLGTSLLVKNDNGNLIPRSDDINSFNIVNATMYANSFLFFYPWYLKAPSSIKSKIVNIPTNFGQYKYMYISSTIKYKSKLYKITKYYNFNALLDYNIKNKINLKLNFTSFKKYFNQDELNEYKNIFDKIKNKLFKDKTTSINPQDLLKFNINNSKNGDTDETTLIYLLFTKIISKDLNNILYIPGVLGESFNQQYNNSNFYYYYINDLTIDNDEINNLCDTNKTINNSQMKLFESLNDIQQNLITKFKCKNFFYIPPEISLKSILYYLNGNNIDFNDKTNIKKIFHMSSFLSNNNFDTSSMIYKGLDRINIKLN